jgi:branched-chain amino acid transport system ATP-binding protein
MMLQVIDLRVSYGKVEVLHGVNLKVAKDEVVCVVGSNGAGKTTMIKAVMGLVPSQGEIFFHNKPIYSLRPAQIARRGISYVPEGRRIFSRLTVLENLEMGGYLCGDTKVLKNRMKRQLDLFPELKSRLKQHGGTLSGGEQQMLAISRALMADPKTLLLDEPSMGLAPMVVERVFKVIKDISQQGISILLVEQNAAGALAVSDRGYVLEEGTVLLSDKAENLQRNKTVQESYLGGHLE